jgi:hypothetical protein
MELYTGIPALSKSSETALIYHVVPSLSKKNTFPDVYTLTTTLHGLLPILKAISPLEKVRLVGTR